MTALADGVVCILADTHDLVFLLSDRQRVAGNEIAGQLAWRMLDDHLGEVRMCALVEQDDAVVALKEFACQLADGGDGDFIFYTHGNASPDCIRISQRYLKIILPQGYAVVKSFRRACALTSEKEISTLSLRGIINRYTKIPTGKFH